MRKEKATPPGARPVDGQSGRLHHSAIPVNILGGGLLSARLQPVPGGSRVVRAIVGDGGGGTTTFYRTYV